MDETASDMGVMDEMAISRLVSESAVRPNEIALYEESCCRLRVLIVADHSDEAFERCTLLVLENVGLMDAPSAPAVGCRFDYQRCRGVHCYGMARLIRGGGDVRDG